MRGHFVWAKVGAAAALVLAMSGAHALSGKVVVNDISQPVYLTAPTGDSRLFALEKGGVVRIIANGQTLATPFLDLSSKVDIESERGLLGLAFDPNYASNGRFYVNYIDKTTLNTVVERYTVATPSSNVASVSSVQNIITVTQEPYGNHKAGWIAFRPGDNQNLYIATGDGGDANDPNGNAQNGSSLLGKVLRLDVSGSSAGYSVPTTNPFVGSSTTRAEIWALGVRNPWRNSFDRQNGNFWIADVGQGVREEINLELAGDPGGHNYGWRLREGTVETPGVGGDAPGLTDPVFDYEHLDVAGGLGNSITGGYVYRGPSIEGADGRYFFADFVSSRVFSFLMGADGKPFDLRDDTAALLGGTGLSGPTTFGEDSLGRLYIAGINGTVVVMVPEPETWVSMLAGLAVLVTVRRRASRA
ncbi:PQQ-dependent sugar dehydrogenase [Aquabacterium sp.]|uniref:PQQ-dependent sugar dehydrogenase n=1 Tax=Aquabacterium sp. TaxID=1872578 RepID=UPI003D6C90C7